MSFIKKRNNLLSKKLKQLTTEFKRLKSSKIDLDFYQSYFFLDIFMNLHHKLSFQISDIKEYYNLIDKYILDIKNVRNISKNFGFEKKILSNKKLIKDIQNREYYGMLFNNFSNFHYYDEPYRLLKIRLKINNFDLKSLKGKSLLDYGCGAGRYTQAFAKLGCKNILGVDFSHNNIQTAKKKNKFKSLVSYKIANVNKNRLKSNSFDYIFCNGVLHHTGNILKGLKEIRRILKPGGKCIIYLSSTDGVKWYFIEAFREIVKDYNKATFAKHLRMFNLKYSKIFYLMDHVFVKYNDLTTKSEVENLFFSANLKIVKKLTRGHHLDDTERYFQLRKKRSKKIAFDIYGFGEHRYIISK